MSRASCALHGTFEVSVAGTPRRFDTTLATVAAIEERCGDASIVDILNGAVTGRRARDLSDLLAAALASSGVEAGTARDLAGGASLAEAESFVLALIAALGFEVGRRDGEGERPLADASNGGDGGSSPSGR